MGILSGFLNVHVNAVKPLQFIPGHVAFLLATQDAFRERLFMCVLIPSQEVESGQQIMSAIDKLSASDFYRVPNDIRDGIPTHQRTLAEPQIMCELGELHYMEFGPEQLAHFGKAKQWFK